MVLARPSPSPLSLPASPLILIFGNQGPRGRPDRPLNHDLSSGHAKKTRGEEEGTTNNSVFPLCIGRKRRENKEQTKKNGLWTGEEEEQNGGGRSGSPPPPLSLSLSLLLPLSTLSSPVVSTNLSRAPPRKRGRGGERFSGGEARFHKTSHMESKDFTRETLTHL